METPRKFITAKRSIRKPGSSSVLIICYLFNSHVLFIYKSVVICRVAVAKHTWTYDHRIKWDEATILAIDSHKFSRKMRESIEIEKHNTIDQEGMSKRYEHSSIYRAQDFSACA